MSRSEIPSWVIGGLRLWGRQKRRIWIGTDWHGNVDGYAQSLLGRIRDEREGAGEQGARSQHWPEVFLGEGLDVQRALIGMPEVASGVLHLHYVWDPEWGITVTRKARCVGLQRDVYYDHLDRAEYWIWARLEAKACDYTQIVEEVNKIVRGVLQTGGSEAINSQTREKCQREVDLSALNRPKVSMR
jgi:hypothetical protein